LITEKLETSDRWGFARPLVFGDERRIVKVLVVVPSCPNCGPTTPYSVGLCCGVHTTCDNRPMRLHDYAPRPAHLKWLLDSDPAIRWQVMRDLTGEASDAIAAERSRVATEGWGAQLLALQSPAGNWGGGPRGWRDDLPKEDRGLLIALYTLVVLKDLGLDPASKQARRMIERVDKQLVFKRLNNRPFLHGETEPCINGRILAIGSYFKEPNDALANQLLDEQLEDGGWNCEAPKSRRSSFHSTICVLEGLLAYERAGRKSAAVTKARKRAENYLLERRMFRSLRTGEVIHKRWLRFSFPSFWHYDVLRGLDYLRNAGIKPDSRVSDAIETVIERRHRNGRWPLNLLHPEHIPLEMETDVGRASHWNTLRALRVLRWYNNPTW
jgi:hypothetical protein